VRPGRLGPAAAFATLALAAACRREPAGLDPDVYVEAMARLSYADIVLFERARVDSARAAILSDLGVTAAELVAFADRNGDDIARMQAVWGRIRDRVDSLEATAAAGDTVDAGGARATPRVAPADSDGTRGPR